MSDYIFSSKKQPKEYLYYHLRKIYKSDAPLAYEFHGKWGSLAVTKQHYNGFLPYENDQHLMVVIGGPVLYFRDNDFLVQADSCIATKSIYNRWVIDGLIQWDEDLSGPFTILLIDKLTASVTIVTDLMSFIPIYTCQKENDLYLGTHVDALAKAADVADMLDQVSLADFVLNDVVTYPYTVYQQIWQSPPSSAITYNDSVTKSVDCYWHPTEDNPYKNLKEAAEALRAGIYGYVDRVTEKTTNIAQFISAGEDSRALSGLLAEKKGRNAFIFLDHMNREGEIAKKVAATYGAKFNVGLRSKTHYLDILPEASRLVGSGCQYTHAHTWGFDKKFNLTKYDAIFGGFLSDTLLKGHHIKKFKGYGKFPFLPQAERKNFSLCGSRFGNASKFFKFSDEVKKRQLEREHLLKQVRPTSFKEWFNYFPTTMHNDMPNLYSTRRLFKSYEPFMCKEAVKISAAVPTSWKLNRRLFNQAMKPYLKPSKWLFHADGRLPYFNWKVNVPIQFSIWFYRHIAKRVGLIKGNQGPWGDWNAIFNDDAWQATVASHTKYATNLKILNDDVDVQQLLTSSSLTKAQKINLLQVLDRFEYVNSDQDSGQSHEHHDQTDVLKHAKK
ncbi:hypothetical protein [Vibrio cincinnatiensis]|uniref:hypothetical protein n=1 Tax=Vibrio cincinnatiensis TaxID=675 RepID=UPI001EE0F6CF|nr:hypothetical protein [Vibrio cincinnatiensis]MCG3741551.1 hypothetical protein [Vibrio cincinnatiensis]